MPFASMVWSHITSYPFIMKMSIFISIFFPWPLFIFTRWHIGFSNWGQGTIPAMFCRDNTMFRCDNVMFGRDNVMFWCDNTMFERDNVMFGRDNTMFGRDGVLF